ncbi:MAG: hypothetical protein L0H53_10445, partial [Candidatus Nitrosocosmicus sp.]|nr:hypothetical protein [Candidatus Nitrosocosmicus sp.]
IGTTYINMNVPLNGKLEELGKVLNSRYQHVKSTAEVQFSSTNMSSRYHLSISCEFLESVFE